MKTICQGLLSTLTKIGESVIKAFTAMLQAIKNLLHIKSPLKVSNSDSWAIEEIRLACKKEAPDLKPGEWDYGTACYKSALKAYEALCGDGHSGMSIGFTKAILNRLIDHKPLTPIEDVPEIWNDVTPYHSGTDDNYIDVGQCKRMSSLFKYTDVTRNVTYQDVNQYICVEIDNQDRSYYAGYIREFLKDDLLKITMPYYPEARPIKIFCEEFLVDPKRGDFDTVGIIYAIKPDATRVDLNVFIKETDDGWEKITKDEYYLAKSNQYHRN